MNEVLSQPTLRPAIRLARSRVAAAILAAAGGWHPAARTGRAGARRVTSSGGVRTSYNDSAGRDAAALRQAGRPAATVAAAVVFLFACHTTAAELELALRGEPQQVFGGAASRIEVTLHNPGAEEVSVDASTRLLQLSSTTAAPLGEAAWKALRVLPGQTILEFATVPFPDVRAETRFALQFLDPDRRVFGTTEVLVYPTNLLEDLKALANGDGKLGVFDPENQVKPLLSALRVEFVDLELVGIEGFQGNLAIVGPFGSKDQVDGALAGRIEKLAEKGAGVVWIQPGPEPGDKLQPSFYTVAARAGAVVVVQPNLVANLAGRPQSQLNLIFFARMARQPDSLRLPGLASHQ